MLGIIWYRAKVLSILEKEYDYKPAVPGWQAPVFNGVTRHIRNLKGNEYDGAIAFMLVQINSLLDLQSPEVKEFYERVSGITEHLMPLGKLGQDVINDMPTESLESQ